MSQIITPSDVASRLATIAFTSREHNLSLYERALLLWLADMTRKYAGNGNFVLEDEDHEGLPYLRFEPKTQKKPGEPW